MKSDVKIIPFSRQVSEQFRAEADRRAVLWRSSSVRKKEKGEREHSLLSQLSHKTLIGT